MSDLGRGDSDDDDLRVAEYVLGVLGADERAAMARRIESSAALQASADAWAERLSGLNAAYGEHVPDPALYDRIATRLFPAAPALRWYEQLAFWRAATVGALGVALLGIGLNVLPLRDAPPSAPFHVANLSAPDSGVMVVALIAPDTDTLHLVTSGAAAPSGSDYELWALPPDGAPVSLGVLASGVSENRTLAAVLSGELSDAFSLAVSLEPVGGSPTGAPTGPVIAVAPLTQMMREG